MIEVRPAAQVLERVVPVGADDDRPSALVAILVDAALRQPVDQLQLVRLALEKLPRFVGAHLAIGERVLAGDDLAHPFLDLGQILGREGPRAGLRIRAKSEVVDKPVTPRVLEWPAWVNTSSISSGVRVLLPSKNCN